MLKHIAGNINKSQVARDKNLIRYLKECMQKLILKNSTQEY